MANLKELEKRIDELRENSRFYMEAQSMWTDFKVFVKKHKLGVVVGYLIFIALLALASYIGGL